MKKAKVLYSQFIDKSSMDILRIYTEEFFEQGEKDVQLLNIQGDPSKIYVLIDTEIYNSK